MAVLANDSCSPKNEGVTIVREHSTDDTNTIQLRQLSLGFARCLERENVSNSSTTNVKPTNGVMSKAKRLDELLESLFEPMGLLDNLLTMLHRWSVNAIKHKNGCHTCAKQAHEAEKKGPEFWIFTSLSMGIAERMLALAKP